VQQLVFMLYLEHSVDALSIACDHLCMMNTDRANKRGTFFITPYQCDCSG